MISTQNLIFRELVPVLHTVVIPCISEIKQIISKLIKESKTECFRGFWKKSKWPFSFVLTVWILPSFTEVQCPSDVLELWHALMQLFLRKKEVRSERSDNIRISEPLHPKNSSQLNTNKSRILLLCDYNSCLDLGIYPVLFSSIARKFKNPY